MPAIPHCRRATPVPASAFFEGDHTVVEVNTTGNSGADMQIELDGRLQLAASDFFFVD